MAPRQGDTPEGGDALSQGSTCSDSGVHFVEGSVYGDASSQASGAKEEEFRGETPEEQVARLVKEQSRAKQEAREQRRRAEAAEIQKEQFCNAVQRMKRELAEAGVRERELQAHVAALEKDKKASQKLKQQLADAKAAAWHDCEVAAAADVTAHQEIACLRRQLQRLGVEPETSRTLSSASSAGASVKQREAQAGRTTATTATTMQAAEQRQREEEENNKERRRLEDLELERQRAERAAAAQKVKEQRIQQSAERKRQREEQRQQAEQERNMFSPEDFAALQALRESVQPAAEEDTAGSDEDDLLEKEIARVRKEEAELVDKQASPAQMMKLMLGGDNEMADVIDMNAGLQKVQQQKQRAALKQKIQMRRELASVVGPLNSRGARR